MLERPLLAIIGHRGGVGEPLSQVGRRDGQLDLKLVQSPRSKELKKKKNQQAKHVSNKRGSKDQHIGFLYVLVT